MAAPEPITSLMCACRRSISSIADGIAFPEDKSVAAVQRADERERREHAPFFLNAFRERSSDQICIYLTAAGTRSEPRASHILDTAHRTCGRRLAFFTC